MRLNGQLWAGEVMKIRSHVIEINKVLQRATFVKFLNLKIHAPNSKPASIVFEQ